MRKYFQVINTHPAISYLHSHNECQFLSLRNAQLGPLVFRHPSVALPSSGPERTQAAATPAAYYIYINQLKQALSTIELASKFFSPVARVVPNVIKNPALAGH
jgi:hypothetical protein